MRRYLVGNEVCGQCGHAAIVVNVRPRLAGLRAECVSCGRRAARVAIYFDTATCPDLDVFIRFDIARTKLGLPDLADDLWQ